MIALRAEALAWHLAHALALWPDPSGLTSATWHARRLHTPCDKALGYRPPEWA